MRFGHEPTSRLAHHRPRRRTPRGEPAAYGHGHPGRIRERSRLALARAQGCRLVDRAALRFRRRSRRHGDPHGDLPHGDRREPRSVRSLALSRPGDDGTLPHHHLRRRAALRAGRRAGRGRDRRASRPLLRSVSRGTPRGDRAAAGAARQYRRLRLPLDPLGHSAPVRGHPAPFQHRHQWRHRLRARVERCHRDDLHRQRLQPCGRRPLQGRLHHAQPWAS